MPFITMKQHYKSKLGRGTDYVSLLPKKLTLRPHFVARRFDDHLVTVFREVDVLLAKEVVTPAMRHVFNTRPHRKESQPVLLAQLRGRLRSIVRDNWAVGGVNVVLHSSGLDSRMLSWTIRQLYQELGDDWLGQVLFLCSRWESKSFKGIMRYEGWEPDQYWVDSEEVSNQEYYAPELLDFRGAWQRANGISAIPVNLFWRPVELAEKAGLLSPDKPITLWTGQWGNTVLDAGSGSEAGEGIRKKFRMFYYSALCTRPMKGDTIIHPYTDCQLAAIVASSKVRLGARLRFALVKSIDERLSTFTNEMSDGDRHRRIADWIVSRMVSDYQSSWYGRKVAPGARPKYKTTEFQSFWSRWTTASLCEYLLENGYEIRIAGS